MKIEVNDGFVELIDHMGDDLAIVNAARVSYAGESKEWAGKDEKLLRYLWDHDHSSPLDMAISSLGLKHQSSF
jgi:thymidylate synthase (FAD)